MHRKLITLALAACLFAALPGVRTTRAQSDNPAADLVVFVQGGNLWVWNVATGESQPITLNTQIRGIAVSPAGGAVAVLDWAPISYDAVERVGGIGGGPLPSDISLINYVTLEPGYTIAPQPEDASFFTPNVMDNAILRSTPVWSPDGGSLAWAEVHYPSFTPESNRVMIYTVATGETRMLVSNLPESGGVPGPLDVKWGEGGFALLYYAFDPADASMRPHLLISDTNGTLLSDTLIPEEETGVFQDYQWVTGSTAPALLLTFADGHAELLDPTTGTHEPAPGTPQLYSTVFPDDSLALSYGAATGAADYWNSFAWTATTPDGQPIALPVTASLGSVALDAGGQRIAYTNDHGGLSVWQGGQVIDMPGTLVVDPYAPVFWGPNGWRVGASSTDAPLDACAGTLPPRLPPGTQAQVIPGTSANNLRAEPGAGAASLGQIDPGAAFAVLDGPLCAEGLYWVQVDFNGVTGWTAEGDASGYWIEPVPSE